LKLLEEDMIEYEVYKNEEEVIKREKEIIDLYEPKTFDCGFKALSWLVKNPMREIDVIYNKENGLTFFLKISFNEVKKTFNYGHSFIWDNCSKDPIFKITTKEKFFLEEIFNWKNIKVLPKEENEI
jgi:hypothetical protein